VADAATVNTYATLLEKEVAFYRLLSAPDRERFVQRVAAFLDRVQIEGIHTTVQMLDKVLVAASAVIPIWGFDDWEYRNIDTVLLYPDTFDQQYRFAGNERNVLGMVGDGAMHRQMILSKPALRAGFRRQDAGNTGIHEFVHLLDKSDGSTDGVPEQLLQHQYAVPWLKAMHREINSIRQGRSDIDPYAATNDAEFLAVASEYFFEKPQAFREQHPELYALLSEAFRQQPR
jgi:Mlc titration factor MtfA (ptsG expression regulator)